MNKQSTDDLAARLRSAAEAATPGPWTARQATGGRLGIWSAGVETDSPDVADIAAVPQERDQKRAAYIALANPENVLALLDERRNLRTLLEAASSYVVIATRSVSSQSRTRYELLAEIDAVLGTTEGAD